MGILFVMKCSPPLQMQPVAAQKGDNLREKTNCAEQ